MFTIPDEDRVCGTCAHWQSAALPLLKTILGKEVAPCTAGAINVSAGDDTSTLVLLGRDNHCRVHGEKWEPSSDYLDDASQAVGW